MAAESRAREIIVGIMFFIAMGFFFLFAIIITSKELGFGTKTQRVVVRFENIKGITEGTPVNLNGNPIGKVVGMRNNIELGVVDVDISIDASVRFHHGSIIEVQSSIFGFRTIEITDNPEKGKAPKFLDLTKPVQGATVPDVFLQISRISAQFTELIIQGQEVMSDVKSVTEAINSTESGIIGKFVKDRAFADKVQDLIMNADELVGEAKRTAEELTKDLQIARQGEGVIAMLLSDAAVAQDVRNTISDVRSATDKFSMVVDEIEQITSDIEQGKGAIGWLVSNEDAKDDFAVFVKALKNSSPDIEETIKNVESITHKIDVGQGSVGKLINDDRLLLQVENALNSATRAMEDIRELTPITTFTSLLFQAFQ